MLGDAPTASDRRTGTFERGAVGGCRSVVAFPEVWRPEVAPEPASHVDSRTTLLTTDTRQMMPSTPASGTRSAPAVSAQRRRRQRRPCTALRRIKLQDQSPFHGV
jgi:hypothetical protein